MQKQRTPLRESRVEQRTQMTEEGHRARFGKILFKSSSAFLAGSKCPDCPGGQREDQAIGEQRMHCKIL